MLLNENKTQQKLDALLFENKKIISPEENNHNKLKEGFELIENDDEIGFKKYLLKNKKYINNKDKHDMTLLGYASLFLNLNIIDLLIKNGADLTITVNDKLVLEVLYNQLENTNRVELFTNYFKDYFFNNEMDEFNNMISIYNNLSRLIQQKKYFVIEKLLSLININKYPYVFSRNNSYIYHHFPLSILGFINNNIEFIKILKKLNFNVFIKTKQNIDILDYINKYKNKLTVSNNSNNSINFSEWINCLNKCSTKIV